MALGNIGGIEREAGVETRSAIQKLDQRLTMVDNTYGRLLRNGNLTIDHSLLQNLDYAHSGHTGFASSAQLTAHTGAANHPYLDAIGTWTLVQTFSSEDVHNAGVDLGTSGRLDSHVADAASCCSILLQPSVPITSAVNRYLFDHKDSAGNSWLAVNSAGSVLLARGSTDSGAVGQSVLECPGNLPNAAAYGLNFNPLWGATSGAANAGFTAAFAASFQARDNASATCDLVGGLFAGTQSLAARAHTNVIGGLFTPFTAAATSSGSGSMYGFYVKGVGTARSSTGTAIYGGFIGTMLTGSTPTVTNQYGLYVDEQTGAGSTNKYGLFLATGTAGYKAIAIRDTNATITSPAAASIQLNGTNTTIAGTNVGLYTAAAVPQATTAGAASTFTANTSGIVDDSATWDGYTIGQLVKAARNIGMLA